MPSTAPIANPAASRRTDAEPARTAGRLSADSRLGSLMSADNVETVQRAYEFAREAWARRDSRDPELADTIRRLFHPDVVVEENAQFPDAAAYRGYDGLLQWWSKFFDVYDEIEIEPQELIPAGDVVVARVRQSLRSRMGVALEQDLAHVWTLHDGKIVHVTGYHEMSDALEAVGAAAGPRASADVVRRQFEALSRGGVDAAAELWAPEIDWRAAEGAADDVGLIRGPQALGRYYRGWLETFDELRAEVEEVIADDGERCAVAMRNSGRPRGSDAVVRGRYYVVCTVRDGRIVSGREYATREEALEALGVRGDEQA
jgi:ketosteroid isomerase-like protein